MKYYLLIISILFSTLTIGQRIETPFGKNRVQFHKDYDEWRKYQSEHFTSYWYGRAKNIANVAVDIAEEEYEEVRKIMEYRLRDKIELLVFTDLTDLKQSNIGKEEIFVGDENEVSVIGNKIFVHFDGNHKHLYNDIRSGIAKVFFNQMYIGSDIKEILKNKFILSVPEWYKGGLVSYIANRWDENIDNDLHLALGNRAYEKWDFDKLSNKHPRIIGHSLWYFIDQTYGRSAISNILYLTRIYKNSEEAFLYELGNDMETILEEWKIFYRQYASSNKIATKKLNKKDYFLRSRKQEKISKLNLSPSKDKLLFVRNILGKYCLELHDFNQNETKTLFKFGAKNGIQETDYNYPIITWDNEKTISIIYEKRDVIYLRKMNINTQDYVQQKLPNSVQRIYSISSMDEERYIVTASKEGHGELFIYNAKKRQFTPLTDDRYDKYDAKYINDGNMNGILYSSTQIDREFNSLDIKNGVFKTMFLDLGSKSKKSIPIVIDNISEHSKPKYLGNGKISYLSDKSGFNEIYIYNLKTEKSTHLESKKNIVDYELDFVKNKMILITEKNQRQYMMINDARWQHTPIVYSSYKQKLINESNQVQEKIKTEVIKDYFISKFNVPIKDNEITLDDQKKSKKHEFKIDNITGARLEFRLDDYSFEYNNDILFEGLESYIEDQNSAQFVDNKGFLLKANTTDLFENYNIEAGIRIPTRINGNEVYLLAQDDKRLLDKEYIIYRKSKNFTNEDETNGEIIKTKKVSYLGMYRLKYPFDVYRSVRMSTSLNNEKYMYQAIDDQHYDDPILNNNRISLKLEYIYDNTIQKERNMLHGTRYKVFAEGINKFELSVIDNPTFKWNEGHTLVLGGDWRHYLPVGEHAVLASRLAMFASFGSDKILYQLGGVENWVNPSFAPNNIDLSDQNFAYRYNVANMRGFGYNARNGSSIGLGTVEFRFFPFKYFTPKRIKSTFLRNFQIDFFYDFGTAWYGLSPYDDNPLNEVHISQPPIFEIDVTYHRDPIIMGYGAGIRSTILGTLFRIDYGYGIESGIIQDPKLYISLGKDF